MLDEGYLVSPPLKKGVVGMRNDLTNDLGMTKGVHFDLPHLFSGP
jgi:hypothetical protein